MRSNPMTRRRALQAAGTSLLALAAGGLLAACGAAGSGSSGGTTAAGSVSLAAGTTSAGGSSSAGASTTAPASSAAATSSAASTTSAAATTSAGSTTTAASTAAAAASTSAASAPPVHANAVDYWQWGSVYQPGFETLAKEFSDAHPSNKVVVSNPSGYWNKVVATLASGTGPDCFLMNNVNFKQYAKNGSVADLSSFAGSDKATSANLQAMLSAGQDWYHYKGKLMGLPWDYSTGVIIYNVDQLRSTSLTMPADLGKQWDWNTMRDDAAKLTQKQGADIKRSGLWIDNGLENGWYTFAVANGGSFFNQDLSQCTIASEQAIAGLDYLLGMLKDGTSATTQYQTAALKANNDNNDGELVINGATSMMLDGDWMFQYYAKAKSLSWDATIFPYSSAGKTANTSNLRGVVMNPAAKNKDNTWGWMANLTTKAIQDRIPTLFSEVPMNNDSATTYYFDPAKGGPPPGRKTLQPDLEATTPLPASDVVAWSDISSTASKIVGQAFDQKLTAADALRQVQDAINGMISANKGK